MLNQQQETTTPVADIPLPEYRKAMLILTSEILAQLRLTNLNASDPSTVIGATALAAGTGVALTQHAPNYMTMLAEQIPTVLSELDALSSR